MTRLEQTTQATGTPTKAPAVGSQVDLVLGPLPEPAAEAVMDLCADHQGPVEALQYLPADAMLYTANQIRAYAAEQVAAERERCAKLCEQEHRESGEHPEMALHCAERIRGLRA